MGARNNRKIPCASEHDTACYQIDYRILYHDIVLGLERTGYDRELTAFYFSFT